MNDLNNLKNLIQKQNMKTCAAVIGSGIGLKHIEAIESCKILM